MMADTDLTFGMPASNVNNPQHWLSRAKKMRSLAASLRDLDARASMLRVADEYEYLAKRAAERADGTQQARQESAGKS